MCVYLRVRKSRSRKWPIKSLTQSHRTLAIARRIRLTKFERKMAREKSFIRSGIRRSHRLTQNSPKSCINSSIAALPQLNDDCLLAIFVLLSFRELLSSVALCSHRFKVLAEKAVLIKCRTEEFPYNFSNALDVSIFKRFRKKMHKIFVYQRYEIKKKDESLKWLKHCKSLKSLHVQNMRLAYNAACFATLAKLEELIIDRSYGTDEEYETLIKQCKALRSISLVNWTQDVHRDILAFVAELPNIERIVAEHDVSMSTHSVQNLKKIAELPKLKYLSFNIATKSPHGVYLDALNQSPSLEQLILKVNAIQSSVAGALDAFPKLRVCQLVYESWVSKRHVQSAKNRLMLDVNNLRKQTHSFDASEEFVIIDENLDHCRVKLIVTLKRMEFR